MLELRTGLVRRSSLRSSTFSTFETSSICIAMLFFGSEFADLLLERVILLDQ